MYHIQRGTSWSYWQTWHHLLDQGPETMSAMLPEESITSHSALSFHLFADLQSPWKMQIAPSYLAIVHHSKSLKQMDIIQYISYPYCSLQLPSVYLPYKINLLQRLPKKFTAKLSQGFTPSPAQA